jgi:hypothetical protein
VKYTRFATIAALPARLFILSIVFQGSHGCLFGLLDFYKTNHNIAQTIASHGYLKETELEARYICYQLAIVSSKIAP